MKINKLLKWDVESETKEVLYLPEEIKREIVQRLPIRSIIRWKCVSKSWRDLIEGGDFVTSHTPILVLYYRDTCTVYDGEAYKPLFKFRIRSSDTNVPRVATYRTLIDSVNGLVLLRYGYANILIVCNPITRGYIELPPQPTCTHIIGFGVSKLTGKYKILYGDVFRSYHICTLGEESWRSIPEPTLGIRPVDCDTAAFLNGNLHWLACHIEGNELILCFDLETELFSSLSLPPRVYVDGMLYSSRLCTLEDRLCLYLCLWDSSNRYKFVNWWMDKYGDENSWVKQYTFDEGIVGRSHTVRPLKVLANGDLLFHNICQLFIYSKKTETIVTCDGLLKLSNDYYSNIVNYIPNFVSLKAMGFHNVQSLPFLYPA